MFAAFALLLGLTLDPRPDLVELQLAGRPRDALAGVQRELAERPSDARRMGLDFLLGHLFDLLGNPADASEAFGAAMASSPQLALHSRYRMALDQERMGHPEVAAGLVASVVEANPLAPLGPEAVLLLARTLGQGGDCRLLRTLEPDKLPVDPRRVLLLAEADCALRQGMRELARNLLVKILEENRDDELGRSAAERLVLLVPDEERGRAPLLLGLTFHQHRDFERALRHLRRAQGSGSLSEKELTEARYAQARAHFWQGRFDAAALLFGELAQQARTPGERARAFYQQGRSYELLGEWAPAAVSFRKAWQAEPEGEWAGSALLSALRLDWRRGSESTALPLYDRLTARRTDSDPALRAALFLASSDIVRGRRDRARAWLDRAVPATPEDRIELAYWRGRLAELDKGWTNAVTAYLAAVRIDLYHPLSQAALRRLGAEPLARAAAAEGRRLAGSQTPEDLYGAWVLLGNGDETGAAAQRRLRQVLLADRTAAPFLRLGDVPVERWPLWSASLRKPEEILLSLGVWHEGAPAVRTHFPVNEPALAFTGSRVLARGGEIERSILQAEALRIRTPGRVPLVLQPRPFHNLLYPFPYRDVITAQTRLRGVSPHLLAAIIREESRWDRTALSPAAARGLTQLTLPTAQRIAAENNIGRIGPEDLYRSDISAALGAAYLAGLLRDCSGLDFLAVAAYNAGEPQVALWRSYCYGKEMEEFFSKVGFQETRGYLRRVLTSQAHYRELY
jgi:soluble lytic murein transglycosylase